MKAIKINVQLHKVEQVIIENYRKIYEEIGQECNNFCCPISLPNNDTLYVDDEGLYHDIQGAFLLKYFNYPIVGNAIILGTDTENGESIDAKTTIQDIENQIIWVDIENAKNYAYNTLSSPFKITEIEGVKIITRG